MPASAATARTVSPPGPVRIRTASAAASSSRSTSADGVRARRAATSPALLMQTIFSYPASSPARLTDYRTMFHSYITTYYINAEEPGPMETTHTRNCLLYTSDAADDLLCVDLGGRRIIK